MEWNIAFYSGTTLDFYILFFKSWRAKKKQNKKTNNKKRPTSTTFFLFIIYYEILLTHYGSSILKSDNKYALRKTKVADGKNATLKKKKKTKTKKQDKTNEI